MLSEGTNTVREPFAQVVILTKNFSALFWHHHFSTPRDSRRSIRILEVGLRLLHRSA